MGKLPYMPFYVDDFEADTAHLTLEEDGVYNRLLRLCWRTTGCSVPDDPAWIARRMRVDIETFHRVVLPILKEFFARENGRLYSPRLRTEWRKANDLSRKRSEAGRKGGRPPKSLENNESGESAAIANEKQNQSIQNHNQNQDSPLNPPDGGSAELKLVHSPQPETSPEAEFEAFWVAYPRRVGKKAAKAKFLAILKRGEATAAQLIAGARAYADEMRREGRPLDKIAHPTTWLNNGRWEDEYEVTSGGDPTVGMTPEQLERYRRIIEERQRG